MTCASCGANATTTIYITLDAATADRVGLAGRRMLAAFTCRTCASTLHRNPEAVEHVLGRLAEKLERS